MTSTDTLAGRDWAREPERIAWIYPNWKLGKKTTGPGLDRGRTWAGATITIEALDLITPETRLQDQQEQNAAAASTRSHGRPPHPAARPGTPSTAKPARPDPSPATAPLARGS